MHHATRRPIALRVAATLAVTTVLLAGASAADAAPRKLPYKKGSAATIAKRGWVRSPLQPFQSFQPLLSPPTR